ncbi:MAG: DUF2905 domain-containing protein [Deltaproteobacteria bacterium]|nr:DUF2905 domain-containing protein [Candidatus Zymogenaceae bacterium]
MSGIEEIRQFGWILVVIGLVIVLMGGVLLLSGKIPFFGRLPGDIMVKREHFTIYFPIVSMLIISAVISIILFLVRK